MLCEKKVLRTRSVKGKVSGCENVRYNLIFEDSFRVG